MDKTAAVDYDTESLIIGATRNPIDLMLETNSSVDDKIHDFIHNFYSHLIEFDEYLDVEVELRLLEDREMLMPPSFYREYVDPISTALNHA